MIRLECREQEEDGRGAGVVVGEWGGSGHWPSCVRPQQCARICGKERVWREEAVIVRRLCLHVFIITLHRSAQCDSVGS